MPGSSHLRLPIASSQAGPYTNTPYDLVIQHGRSNVREDLGAMYEYISSQDDWGLSGARDPMSRGACIMLEYEVIWGHIDR